MSGFSRDQLSAIRGAVAYLTDGYALFDSDDHLVVWNEAYESLNIKVRDLVVEGANFESLIRALVERGQIPEAVGREQQWIEERIRVRRSGGRNVERQVQVSDGRWFLARERVTPDGGVVGIWYDITERKQADGTLRESDERFQVAFENAPIGVALITPEGKRFKVNKALADFLGYSVEELTDTTMNSTAGDLDDLGESMRLRQQVLDGEITTYRNERRYSHKQGHVVWV